MKYAISILSDNPTSAKIVSLWHECIRLEPDQRLQELEYPPHITLAVYEDISKIDLFHATDSVFELHGEIALNFASIEYFVSPVGYVLWLKPELPNTVYCAHQKIHELTSGNKGNERYHPGRWTPHCTIAMHVRADKKNEIDEMISREFEPFTVTFDKVSCVSFYPVRVLHERSLANS